MRVGSLEVRLKTKNRNDNMDKMTYTKAVARLEEIMETVQGGKLDVDELSGLLKEASELVKFCREKLYKVDEEVKALIDDNFGE